MSKYRKTYYINNSIEKFFSRNKLLTKHVTQFANKHEIKLKKNVLLTIFIAMAKQEKCLETTKKSTAKI